MKVFWFLVAMFSYSISIAAHRVIVNVKASKDCQKESLSVLFVQTQERPDEYLYQSFVPIGGTTEIELKKGKYTLEAVNKDMCFGKVAINNFKKTNYTITLNKQ